MDKPVIYAKIAYTQDLYDPTKGYTLLAVSPSPAFDEGRGDYFHLEEQELQELLFTFGEENLIGGHISCTSFIYPQAQGAPELVALAESLAEEDGVSLDWFNDALACKLAREGAQVERDDVIAAVAGKQAN